MANINAILKEMKEYRDMQAQLESEIEALKAQAIEYMEEQGIDEVIADDGTKATWRSNISSRFDSTAFKRVHADLYNAFVKKTEYRRFTLN